MNITSNDQIVAMKGSKLNIEKATAPSMLQLSQLLMVHLCCVKGFINY
ncbi:hypothetical protein SAMN05192529_10254 [Arachidicoccus rhizosphaerae]|uniref:Uncharacterized protein n=1 Tax=Arachidicoccus rhizosphaerae TaxID=551991 RepID=A0A1H3W1Q2_9BACT|nr:hypothetical protein [Arachidicoccus rhizosphaerae]SDZ80900.1 hypothetical protein SAMN05192529_10254 [Arachidicoccus rhizosphaerae]